LPDARRGVHGFDDGGGRRSAARRVVLRLFRFFFGFVRVVRLVGRGWVDQLGWRLVVFRRER
jgi:hypothetical protein